MLAKANYVVGGSGTNLYLYWGAMKAMFYMGISPNKVIGCSGGALTGVLLSAFNPQTKEEFRNVERLLLDSIPYENKLLDFTYDIFYHYGLVKGKRIRKHLRSILLPVCNDNFDEMPIDFTCVATNVTKQDIFYIGRNSGLRVSDAVYASMSFPGVFAPIRLFGVDEYQDGGIVNNFPIDYFPNEPTIGLKVIADQPDKKKKIKLGFFKNWLSKIRMFGISRRMKFLNHWLSMIGAMMEENERERIEDNPDAIIIYLHGPRNSMNLFITREEARAMIDSGFKQTVKYIMENEHAFKSL